MLSDARVLAASESAEEWSTAVADADDATDMRGERPEPTVLTLNREAGIVNDMMLSRRPGTPLCRIMLCRRVRSSTFFSVNGKYSARWFVMSSLGGRWPKKLRTFAAAAEARRPCFVQAALAGEEGDKGRSFSIASVAFSGKGTPRPERTEIVDARR